jgi:hypothetical protein
MKMMKKLFRQSIIVPTLLLTISIFQFSCKKETIPPPEEPTCNLSGTYIGTSTETNGEVHVMTYELRENNFAVGRTAEMSDNVTFGGYKNTCDSIFLSVYYVTNKSYYLLKGKLSNNGTVISGTYNNLTTTSDAGTFNISK